MTQHVEQSFGRQNSADLPRRAAELAPGGGGRL
jgi:hypothetical protein